MYIPGDDCLLYIFKFRHFNVDSLMCNEVDKIDDLPADAEVSLLLTTLAFF